MADSAQKEKKKKKKDKNFDKETYHGWYETMMRIRRFENKALQMYGQNKIRGFCHVYIGQEAIAAGMQTAIKKDDAVVTGYRQHGIAISRGIGTKEAMAELFGKRNGVNKGKGGSMHFFSKKHRYFGGNGIVGATIPIGTGIGLAEQYRESDLISVTMFGDGAARQGSLHESFNMAMTWKLPVLYICENNGYAMGTSVERSSNVTDIHTLGEAYDMPHEDVNGMDVEEVHNALEKATKHVREGNGPYFLEMKTYRYKGHSVSDPANYRSRDEVKEYKEKDPIKILEKRMLDKDLISEDEIKEIKSNIQEEIDEAVEFAEKGDYPDPSELYEDNYQQEDYPFIRD